MNAHTTDLQALLDAVPVGCTQHFGRTLSDHLIGTYRLLHDWGNPHHVCLAGLMHSVYGTNTFRSITLERASRQRLQQLIGEQAEALVYAFGFSDRKALLLDNQREPFAWKDFETGERTVIERSVLAELIEIEVANLLDQLPYLGEARRDVMRDMGDRFSKATSLMSDQARRAVKKRWQDEESGTALR